MPLHLGHRQRWTPRSSLCGIARAKVTGAEYPRWDHLKCCPRPLENITKFILRVQVAIVKMTRWRRPSLAPSLLWSCMWARAPQGSGWKSLVTEAFTVLREWLKPKLHKSKIPVDAPRIFPCNALKYVILLHALVWAINIGPARPLWERSYCHLPQNYCAPYSVLSILFPYCGKPSAPTLANFASRVRGQSETLT